MHTRAHAHAHYKITKIKTVKAFRSLNVHENLKVTVVSLSTKGRKVVSEQYSDIPHLFNPLYVRNKESVLAG